MIPATWLFDQSVASSNMPVFQDNLMLDGCFIHIFNILFWYDSWPGMDRPKFYVLIADSFHNNCHKCLELEDYNCQAGLSVLGLPRHSISFQLITRLFQADRQYQIQWLYAKARSSRICPSAICWHLGLALQSYTQIFAQSISEFCRLDQLSYQYN